MPPTNEFIPVQKFKRKSRLMIGIEGMPDSGKTEFSLSAPPGIGLIAVDRGYEHVLAKEVPPSTRQENIHIRVFKTPQAGQDPGKDEGKTYSTVWNEFYQTYRDALNNPLFRTIVIDGDSDTWELQQLAAFGKLTQIPPIQRTEVNAARRVMIARGFDSGKNVIFTYRLKPEYAKTIKINGRGEPSEIDERTGEYKRSGFSDQDYLVQVQLRTMYDPARPDPTGTGSNQYGVRILKCKVQPDLVGFALWGDECNFPTLIKTIFPGDDLTEWGYSL